MAFGRMGAPGGYGRLGGPLGGAAFNPKSLFAGGVGGAWYDVSNLSSMFRDSAGTIPASVGYPVGKQLDLSGNGNHRTQPTSGQRPMLRQNGSFYYLEYDGISENLISTSFAVSFPFVRISALRQISFLNTNIIHCSATTLTNLLQQSSAAPAGLRLYDGISLGGMAASTLDVDQVLTEVHGGASASSLQINRTTPGTNSVGTATGSGWRTGMSFNGLYPSQIHDYGGALVVGSVSAANIAKMQQFLAGKAGVTL